MPGSSRRDQGLAVRRLPALAPIKRHRGLNASPERRSPRSPCGASPPAPRPARHGSVDLQLVQVAAAPARRRSSPRPASPLGRSVAFSIPEGFCGGRGGKFFSRRTSSFSSWFSRRCPAIVALSFSFSAPRRSTSPNKRRTKPTNSVGGHPIRQIRRRRRHMQLESHLHAFDSPPHATKFAPVAVRASTVTHTTG